jgi:hypothetical protein
MKKHKHTLEPDQKEKIANTISAYLENKFKEIAAAYLYFPQNCFSHDSEFRTRVREQPRKDSKILDGCSGTESSATVILSKCYPK